MISSKRLQYFLIATLSLVFCRVRAQQIDEKTYLHKIHLMDSLSFYKMKDYDTLYQISVLYSTYGNDYKENYYGWINKQTKENIEFININGKQIEPWKKQVTGIKPIPINDTTIDIFIKADKDWYNRGFIGNYLLSLWLYKKGQYDYSKKLLHEGHTLFTDSALRDDFGITYYDAMLSAFTNQRNYPRAIILGDHLSGNIFTGYKYQKEVIALASQLKSNTEDFKTFRIPDSLEWVSLKQKLNRKDQILYLADRLRLLNCIQQGQPGGIDYGMYQFSISFAEAQKIGISYWGHNSKYGIINPFTELIKMKLNLLEMELLLPYLLTDTYIDSYSYFRDFFSERNLHKQSWVVHNLIFDITNKSFFNQRLYDSVSFEQKKTEVEKIKKWCDENATLSKEDLTIKTLKTTDQWNDFKKALETARNGKYSLLLPAITDRFNDFKEFYWPVHKYLIARTMFELGDEKYISIVRKWSKDTSQIEVNLWTSLFLLKYDKDNYEQAITELESVLKQCDGTAYYPHAMNLLLSMNDKRALKMAEGILDKERFKTFIYWDYYLNFIKKLLVLKSDYTFNFISKRLASFTPEEIDSFKQNNGNANMLMQSDFYVLAVDKLKGSKPDYDAASGYEARLEYKKKLSKWFDIQYKLLKEGKPNELLLNVVQENEPVTFVDSPN